MFNRQHSATTIDELVGAELKSIFLVSNGGGGPNFAAYMLVDESWVKIVIDEGVLFASPISDPIEEIEDTDEVTDVLCEAGAAGAICLNAEFKDGVFSAVFEDEKNLQIHEEPNRGICAVWRE